ncbi:MAG: ribulose-phosphate 3-epimerase [bacterium]|nr:ribulose-phosphate 3-epimerase [bacterium]
MSRKIRVAPSVLAADLGQLRSEMEGVDGHVEMFHLDVMDGLYVPNLTFGAPVIEKVRPAVDAFFDCHLMVSQPLGLFEALAKAGADHVTLHTDVCPDPTEAGTLARRLGMGFGLALSPAVGPGVVRPHLVGLDMVVVMSVEPGFGGQVFMPETLSKVETIRRWIDEEGLETALQIDGGITPETAPLAAAAGADVFVAGTAIFARPDPVEAVRMLRSAISSATSPAGGG